MQHYVMNFFSDLRQVRFSPRIKLIARIYLVTEILLKVALNNNHPPSQFTVWKAMQVIFLNTKQYIALNTNKIHCSEHKAIHYFEYNTCYCFEHDIIHCSEHIQLIKAMNISHLFFPII